MRTIVRSALRILGQLPALPADEFLERILCTVPGMVDRENLPLLDLAVRGITGPGPVLEIGVFCGQGTAVLSHLLDRHGKANPIWCVDPFVCQGSHDASPPTPDYLEQVGGNANLTRTEYTRFVREAFLRNTAVFARTRDVVLFEIGSDLFFPDLESGTLRSADGRQVPSPPSGFALTVIDGDHSYEATLRDLRGAAAHAAPGSYVLLDDSRPGGWLGSVQAGREAARDRRLQVVYRRPNLLLRKRI
jgi:hypothetical protein